MSGTVPPLLLFSFMAWPATFHLPFQMYSASNSGPSRQPVVSDQVTAWGGVKSPSPLNMWLHCGPG